MTKPSPRPLSHGNNNARPIRSIEPADVERFRSAGLELDRLIKAEGFSKPAGAARDELQRIAQEIHGGSFGSATTFDALVEATRAENGIAPHWGQAGRFVKRAGDIDFGVDYWPDLICSQGPGIDIYAVGPEPFPSGTGYFSSPVTLAPVAKGHAVCGAVLLALEELVEDARAPRRKRKSTGDEEQVKLSVPETFYRLGKTGEFEPCEGKLAMAKHKRTYGDRTETNAEKPTITSTMMDGLAKDALAAIRRHRDDSTHNFCVPTLGHWLRWNDDTASAVYDYLIDQQFICLESHGPGLALRRAVVIGDDAPRQSTDARPAEAVHETAARQEAGQDDAPAAMKSVDQLADRIAMGGAEALAAIAGCDDREVLRFVKVNIGSAVLPRRCSKAAIKVLASRIEELDMDRADPLGPLTMMPVDKVCARCGKRLSQSESDACAGLASIECYGCRSTPGPIRDYRPPQAHLVMVKVADIDGSHNIRQVANGPSLFQLGESIKDIGLLAPLIVRKIDGDKLLRLVAGGRRLAAARAANEEFIEAKVYSGFGADDAWEAKARLAENVQRSDLTHIELARVYGGAAKAGMSVAAIAAEAHRSDDEVRRHLSLLRLTEPVANLVASGRLPVHQAELIARVGDLAKQIKLAGSVCGLAWDNNAGKFAEAADEPPAFLNAMRKREWKAKREAEKASGNLEPADHVMPMDRLRARVAEAMQGLAAVGWPMDADYAGQRACQGCPDNTLSYADEPVLFAGIKPRGSDKKGFCLNAECYAAKLKLRERERETARKEREREQKAAIVKAKRAGLAVCEECGKVEGGDVRITTAKADGAKLCQACHEKARKRADDGGGGWAAQERARREKLDAAKKAFPSTDEERMAVALFAHGVAVASAIGERVGEGHSGCMGAEAVMFALVVRMGGYSDVGANRLSGAATGLSIASVLESGRLVGKLRAGLWNQLIDLRTWTPAVDCHGLVGNVPLDLEFLAVVDDLEVIARAWGIEIPQRPTTDSIRVAGLRTLLLDGARDEAEPAIANCDDLAILQGILADQEAGKVKKLAGWRDKALIRRIGILEGKAAAGESEPRRFGGPSPIADARNHVRNLILQGGKKEALQAIAACNDPIELNACQSLGIKGDWRRAAVAKRIAELDDLTPDAAEDAEDGEADGGN